MSTTEPRPWTDAHRREAFVRLCELAIERRLGPPGVACYAVDFVEGAVLGDCDSEAKLRALLWGRNAPARIDSEIAIVRARAERAASPPRSRADLLTLIRAAKAGAMRPAEMAESLSRLEWIFASEDAPREKPTLALVADLRDIATGKIEHIYAGTCPAVHIEGLDTEPDRADPTDECPACEVLRRADVALAPAPASTTPAWIPPPGVSVEVLHGDPAGPLLVVKVMLDAGAEVPREEHEEQTETILTVSGEVIVTSAWPDHDGFGCMTIPARVSHVVRNASTTEPATYLAILRRVEREPVGDTEPAPAPAATAVEAGSRSLRVFYGIASGCHSDSDGDCAWVNCPQARDGEPQKTGRHCPLDVREEA